MRQVPRYAIIGAGRMARHFSHYLTLLQIPHRQWSRTQSLQELADIVTNSDCILLLISDAAIETVIQQNPILQTKCLVHFSGQLVTPLAHSAHPLMTFSHDLYPLETYQKVPFILEQGRSSFAELFPQLPNLHFAIPPQLKSLYHSLCVLSGNFTTILWQKFFAELENTFQVPAQVAYPYLQQIAMNLQLNPKAALTGPLARDDQKTITANLQALTDDPFQAVYQAFVDAHKISKR